MATFHTAIPTGRDRTSGRTHAERLALARQRAARAIPPPIQPQRIENLNRRIANLEAIDPGVFTGNVLASFMALPGLVGFWPMSSVQRSTGNVYDLSGQGRTLTYNGNPTFTYYNGLVPYIALDGTGDYLSRPDETDLDIIGTESIFTSGAAGLTLGGWFYNDANFAGGGGTGLVSKFNSGGAATGAYMLYGITTTPFALITNGSTNTQVSSTLSVATGSWYFGAMRFTPSTELSIWINSTQSVNTTSIPASLNNATTPAFEIGAYNGANNLYTGRVALVFLCANALGNDLISSLYQQSRVLLGV